MRVFTTSPFFLLLCEHKHCDNAETDSNSEKSTSRIMGSSRGMVDTEQKKISPELYAIGLLDSTMLRLVLPCREFWNSSTVYFFDFLIVSCRSKLRIWWSVCISFVGFFRQSSHPSACNSWALTGEDVTMINIWVLFNKTLTKLKLQSYLTTIKGTLVEDYETFWSHVAKFFSIWETCRTYLYGKSEHTFCIR